MLWAGDGGRTTSLSRHILPKMRCRQNEFLFMSVFYLHRAVESMELLLLFIHNKPLQYNPQPLIIRLALKF